MCFGSTPKPKVPKPVAPPPTPTPPPRPAPPPPAPEPLQPDREKGVVRTKSTAKTRQAMQRGSSSLRIPLNIGTPKSGGLNL